MKRIVEKFEPSVKSLLQTDTSELVGFTAGENFSSFDEYLKSDNPGNARFDSSTGKGSTHVIFDESNNHKVVAYFTLAGGVIPYDDGNMEDTAISNYPYVTAVELKMFAVSKEYQDCFMKNDDTGIPIAAWCLQYILAYLDYLSHNVIGFQVVYLHSVPTAEMFYRQNGFQDVTDKVSMLFSVDEDLKVMYKDINSNLLSTIG